MSRKNGSGIAVVVGSLLLIPGIGFLAVRSLDLFPPAIVPGQESIDPTPNVIYETPPAPSEASRPVPVAPYDSAAPEDVAISPMPPAPAPALPGATALGRGSRTATAASGAPKGSASLIIPVAGIRREQLVDTYTQARSSGRSHDAIDIPAPRGTPVVAVANGTVLKLFQSVQGGITLYQLDPDQRTIYYYAHLDRYGPNITEGMQLQQGQTLGYVGDTGNSGAGNYHLHFEISTTLDPKQYWGGVASNPYPRLR